MAVRTHGESHGDNKTTEYRIWTNMVDRCTNAAGVAYRYYGARGITICDSWRNSYEAFLSDMGRRPSSEYSLDRIDNNGPYSPENCRWVDRVTQRRNRRDMKLVSFQNQELPLVDWSRALGIKLATLHDRLYKHGWSVERAFLTDPCAHHKKTGVVRES
jgi:hypothetical protein